MMTTIGYYNLKGNRSLSVTQYREKRSHQPLFHEFGHAVDNYGAHALNLKEEELSATFEFQEIFKKEGENLTKNGSTHPAEFFADAFWMIHTLDRQNINKEKAPETYTFIKDILKVITNSD